LRFQVAFDGTEYGGIVIEREDVGLRHSLLSYLITG
jgi:hypothetical protein